MLKHFIFTKFFLYHANILPSSQYVIHINPTNYSFLSMLQQYLVIYIIPFMLIVPNNNDKLNKIILKKGIE